jgi:signal transduction histidine kinase
LLNIIGNAVSSAAEEAKRNTGKKNPAAIEISVRDYGIGCPRTP